MFALPSYAGFSCRLAQRLGDPRIANDANFWEDFGRISDRGNDRELADLLRRHGIDDRGGGRPDVPARGGTPQRTPIQMNQTATRELRLLQPGLREKAEEFMQLARGGSSDLFAQLRQNQGRWQLERLSGMNGLHSVRLNQGYRAVFRARNDGSIEIVNFSKTATHGGH
jgi:hypothetical protein